MWLTLTVLSERTTKEGYFRKKEIKPTKEMPEEMVNKDSGKHWSKYEQAVIA